MNFIQSKRFGAKMGAGMSAPAGTEVTQQSFIGRVCSSMCGMVIGIFLILGCMAFTGWNEGNFVCRAKVISHADEVMVRVPCNATSAAHAAGSLLFFSGCPLTNQKVFDNAPDAAASSLSSEMLAYCMFKCAPSSPPAPSSPAWVQGPYDQAPPPSWPPGATWHDVKGPYDIAPPPSWPPGTTWHDAQGPYPGTAPPPSSPAASPSPPSPPQWPESASSIVCDCASLASGRRLQESGSSGSTPPPPSPSAVTPGQALHVNAVGAWFKATQEMYQWTERKSSQTKKHSVGGGSSTYSWWTFSQAWFDSPAPSPTCSGSRGSTTCCSKSSATSSCEIPACRGSYQYPTSAVSGTSRPSTGACNPSVGQWPQDAWPSGTQYAPDVRVGGHALNDALIDRLTSVRYLAPPMLREAAAQGATQPATSLPPAVLDSSTLHVAQTSNGPIYAQTFSGAPRTGDMRLTWTVNAAQEASVAAAVGADGRLTPWQSSIRCPSSLSMTNFQQLLEGARTHSQLIQYAEDALATSTWVGRFFSLLFMVIGYFMLFQPLSVAPDIIPCIGPFIGGAVGCVIFLVSILCGTAMWLLVTSICWMFFRPLVGVPMCCGSVGMVTLAVHAQRRQRKARQLLNQGKKLADGNVEMKGQVHGQVTVNVRA